MQTESKKRAYALQNFVWISSFRHSWCFTPVCCMQYLRAGKRRKGEDGTSLAGIAVLWLLIAYAGRPAFLGRLRSWVKSSLDCSPQELSPQTFAFWPYCMVQLGLGRTYASAWIHRSTCVLPVWRESECMDPNPSLADSSHILRTFVTGIKLQMMWKYTVWPKPECSRVKLVLFSFSVTVYNSSYLIAISCLHE